MDRIDEPLKSGACDECTHCVQIKRNKKLLFFLVDKPLA